jgi:hypothetical protein
LATVFIDIAAINEDLDKIFGRYNRGSNVSGIVGTGVGLYLVVIVAGLHHGSVTVESVEGKGTCSTVHLPLLHVADDESASCPTSGCSREHDLEECLPTHSARCLLK